MNNIEIMQLYTYSCLLIWLLFMMSNVYYYLDKPREIKNSNKYHNYLILSFIIGFISLLTFLLI